MPPFDQIAQSLDKPLFVITQTHLIWANVSAQTLLTKWQGAKAYDDPLPLSVCFCPSLLAELSACFAKSSAKFDFTELGEHWQGSLILLEKSDDNQKDSQEFLLSLDNITRLIHLEKMRSDFVGNVSHELRTPLTVLMGYLENFVDNADSLPSAWQVGVSRMAEQAGRMNAIVNDLLTLSRLENDEHPEPQVVDMPRLLMQVCDEAQNSNPKSYLIDLHLDTAKKVQGLPIYLHSAILNLVLNALKYTQDDGEIDLIWEEVADGAVLTVADNGIGIGAEHLARLTERFYRVDTGRSRETGGTGLGLAIVKQVAILHNARLEIRSEVGVGSSFCLVFPKFRLVE